MSHTAHDQKAKRASGSRLNGASGRGPFAESQEHSVLFALSVLGLTARATARQFAGNASSVFPRSPKLARSQISIANRKS